MQIKKYFVALIFCFSTHAADQVPKNLELDFPKGDLKGKYVAYIPPAKRTIYPFHRRRNGFVSPTFKDNPYAWRSGFGYLFRDWDGYWRLHQIEDIYLDPKDGHWRLPVNTKIGLAYQSLSNQLEQPPTDDASQWKEVPSQQAD